MMKRNKPKIGKFMVTLIVTLIAVMLLPTQLKAAGSIDLTKESSMIISYQDGEKPLTGTVFAAYRVASVGAYGEMTALEGFEQFDVNIRGENEEAWRTLAYALEEYILQSSILPVASGKINEQGTLSLSNIPQGLYLIPASQHTQDQTIYTTEPFIVMLPALDQVQNVWIYDLTVYPKHTSETMPETPQEDPETPSEDCEPDNPEIPDDDPHTSLDQPGSQLPPTLPQTGQLWWPVPMLLAAGLFLIVLGLLRGRRYSEGG